MIRRGIVAQRLIGVFALMWVLLGYPVLALFDRPATVLGMPLLVVYLLVAWLFVIALLAAIVEWRTSR